MRRRHADEPVGAEAAVRRAEALGDRRPELTWWCPTCAKALLDVHRLPDRSVLAIGYVWLVDVPADRFGDDRGRTAPELWAGALGAEDDDEGRLRDPAPTAHVVHVGDRHQDGPLMACPGGHVKAQRAPLAVALEDLYRGRKRREIPSPGRATRVTL